MLQIYSNIIKKTYKIPFQLNEIEETIFQFVREAVGYLVEKPTIRVAGGWVRDHMMGKPSKDIDITVDIMDGTDLANHLLQFSKQPEVIKKYGPKFVGTVKNTQSRPEQIKKLAVAFVKINGEEIEILPLRGLEEYEKGSRNPKAINYNELKSISENEGIVSYLNKFPELRQEVFKLPKEERNDPTKVLPLLDANRRDLTINSLFYNINTEEIEDFTGLGTKDLETMTLRTPIDPLKTFRDDPLRLLRVLRFHSKYPNSHIAPNVIEAMQDPDVQFQITRKISDSNDQSGIVVERTAIELRKILEGEQPEAAIKIMYEVGLLAKMLNLPSNFHPLEMDQRSKWHSLTVIDHTLLVLKNVNKLSKEFGLTNEQRMMMNFASLFHDLGKLDPRSHKNKPDGTRGYSGDPTNPNALTHEIASSKVWNRFSKALQLSNEETKFVGSLVSEHMRPHRHVEENSTPTDKTLRKYIRKNPNWVFQYVHAMADAMSKEANPQDDLDKPYRSNMDRIKGLMNYDPSQFGIPKVDLLNGTEIIQLVGINPEPPAGKKGYVELIKERIREFQDENPNLNKNEAIEIVQNMISNGELNEYFV